MKKIIFFVLLLCYSTQTNAGVRALGEDPETQSNFNLEVSFSALDTSQKCIENGYKLTDCAMNEFAAYPCPYDDAYFKVCCSQDYRFLQSDCIQNNKEPSQESCGGFYACIESSSSTTE